MILTVTAPQFKSSAMEIGPTEQVLTIKAAGKLMFRQNRAK
jgi:hypothetical protein